MPGSINIPVKLDDGKGGFVDNPQFLEQASAETCSRMRLGFALQGGTDTFTCPPATAACLQNVSCHARCLQLRLVAHAAVALVNAHIAHHSAVPFWLQVKEQVGLEKPLVCTCAHGACPLRLLLLHMRFAESSATAASTASAGIGNAA